MPTHELQTWNRYPQVALAEQLIVDVNAGRKNVNDLAAQFAQGKPTGA